ncbi:aKG-HExxH-type peptide beta-hydroxylase [Streptantibioticus ferralitis]|uniref:HEXXH motif-containing putative peptide modification protein n=1 Tax=Streptantibioticus ferralitis TaxID=236510 RepID=A0ABT5Z6T0_9ACTN|nr:HEXXH motif-containing putative peptide modification protein [Streptantibioticus ferralitis]MDF2259449.1 HEXXH motif-containing putative peptide modification protein [Streptantibioticus ferralitis]
MNIGHTYETTARLVRAVTGTYPDADGLRTAYRETASKLRPMPVEGDGISISYEDGAWAKHCMDKGIFEHIFAGACHSDEPTRTGWDRQAIEALDHIHSLSPDLRRMVDLLVTDIVFRNSGADGGGSASQIPGLVVTSPGEDWQVPHLAECLVHEAMHLNLFVADMVYGTFTLPSRELERDEYRALSAVKIGQKRPLDKAFHAAIVTVPLMYMQHFRGVKTLVDLYAESLRDACADLKKQLPLFTDYGQMLLDELCCFAESIDFDHLAQTISSPEYAGYKPAVAV